MDKKYDHKEIEEKWQKIWQKERVYETSESTDKPKCYVLDMFPYPSGDGLHVGHPKGYIATDIYSRYKKMKGFNILHPMGWDAFGLPAENYAIKNKIHPRKAVEENIQKFKSQLDKIGFNYDWQREINTTGPEFYKWTQWIFIQLFEKGLAYESSEPINWCPSCKTGLANEDLENGLCERCGSQVEKKPIRQWVLKIRDYADRMLADVDQLDWPESIKISQKNWIGRSEGMLFTAPVKDLDLNIETFSAHFEACYADTFVVIAPDHPLLKKLLSGLSNEDEILEFASELSKKQLSNSYEEKEVEGIFTGRYIVDPLGNGDLPIWIASYALADYGTGIVKASAHDERDFNFAKKYGIPLKVVLLPEDSELREKVEKFEVPFTDMKNGILSEPKEVAGKRGGDVRDEIIKHLESKGFARKSVDYKLRDWVFSRQRYWGEPIPIIHCEKCGAVPVPVEDLPVLLPNVDSYEPTGTGESPLASISEWVNTKCPKCDGGGKRETNTMPQWAGSSWYWLRYMDPDNHDELVGKDKEKYWAPVDLYVGGAEHATRHLIYARFWHKFLNDIGVVSTNEPFTSLKNVGLIQAEDGRKMSKRWGNVINPDDIVERFGADSLRVYEMFMGPFDRAIAWNTNGLVGARRFLERVWRLSEKVVDKDIDSKHCALLHKTIKKVGEDIEKFAFNTAVSSMMELVNALDDDNEIPHKEYSALIALLTPFAPHMSQELWHNLGHKTMVNNENWPEYNPEHLIEDKIIVVVQVNGKVRAELAVRPDISEDEVKLLALNDEKVKNWLNGAEPKKVLYVKNKIVSIVL